VRLICLDSRKQALLLDGCSNLTIQGLIIDYDPLPFTQGRVVECDMEGNWFDVMLHDGYSEVNTESSVFSVHYSGTREWKRNFPPLAPHARLESRGRTVRLFADRRIVQSGAVSNGDLVAIVQKSMTGSTLGLVDCAFCTLEDITIHAGGGWCIRDWRGDATRFLGIRITPGPVPPGGTQPRLRSACSDGIHVISGRAPHIERCLIENHGDDGIAVHGVYDMALEAMGARLAIGLKNGSHHHVGDTVRLIDPDRGVITEERRIIAIENPSVEEKKRLEEVKLSTPVDNPNLHKWVADYSILTLDRSPGLMKGYLVDNPTWQGNGFVIRNNTIREHRARGILVKASNGIIEGNMIDGSSLAGIVLSPEIKGWFEAGNSWNVDIRNNVLKNIGGYEYGSPASPQAGAISVVAYGRKGFSPAGAQRNIRIVDNLFDNCRGVNALIVSADNVVIEGNTFRNTHGESTDQGRGWGIDTGYAVWMDRVSGIEWENNFLENPGAFCKGIAGYGNDVSRLHGVPAMAAEE
jgi:hypothetical protein